MMTKEIHDINTRALDFVVELIEYIFEYPDDDYMTMECLCRKLVKHGLLDKADGYYQTHEIRTETHECVKDELQTDRELFCKYKGGELVYHKPIEDEPQYDAEEVAKDINRRVDMVKKEWNARHIEDEPQIEEWHDDCTTCRWHEGACTIPGCDYEPKDEQTERSIE